MDEVPQSGPTFQSVSNASFSTPNPRSLSRGRIRPQAPVEPSPVFLRTSGQFKPASNGERRQDVLAERDHNQSLDTALLWHGASYRFSSAIADRFYKDNSLEKARKLKEVNSEPRVERLKLSRISRIQQQKDALEDIRTKQKAMKSRIKLFIEERLELEHRFEASAITIQRHIRGFLTRRKYVQWMYIKEKEQLGELLGAMQKQINNFWTGMGSAETEASIKIQALYRGYKARKEIAKIREAENRRKQGQTDREKAARIIQRRFKIYSNKKNSERKIALESIRKRLLVLKLKSFWHRKKFVWETMRKKYYKPPPTPVQSEPRPRRPSTAKRTGGGFVMESKPESAVEEEEKSRIVTHPRSESRDEKSELSVLPAAPEPQNKENVARTVQKSEIHKPESEAKRRTVPLIPRPITRETRPPRFPKNEEERKALVPTMSTSPREAHRISSESPPKYLQPTATYKYKTGVDASVDMPQKHHKKRRRTNDSILARPTLSRQVYIQETAEKAERAHSAGTREPQWKPTVGLTNDIKFLPIVVREQPKMPELVQSDDEAQYNKLSPVQKEATIEEKGQENETPSKEFVYHPPIRQSLDFKEALPEYQDFLTKYGKNLKPEKKPESSGSSRSFRSVADLVRVTPHSSAKKVEL